MSTKGKFISLAEASLNISVDVECPHCEETIDLLEVTEMTDDGWIYNQAMGKQQWGNDSFDTKIECPKCSNEFLITKINY